MSLSMISQRALVTMRHAGCGSVAMRTMSTAANGEGGSGPLTRYGRVSGGTAIEPEALKSFEVWHALVEDATAGKIPDLDEFRTRIRDDATFRPPTYFKPWTGGDELVALLSCATEVFGTSFKYRRQWLSDNGREWALEFEAEIADTGKKIDGIDLVQLDENGKIEDFTVLARPPNAVSALKDEMVRRVPVRMAAIKGRKALSSITSIFS